MVPLTLAAAPFIARLVETRLREVDGGLVEAAQSMGATTGQIVWKVLLPEAMPGIVAGLTISFVSLTSYSAMAGAVGGGGLGDLGIRYGYQRFLPDDAGGGGDPDRLRRQYRAWATGWCGACRTADIYFDLIAAHAL